MSSRYVAEWERVIPQLSNEDLQRLEELLKKAQTTNQTTNGLDSTASNGATTTHSQNSDVVSCSSLSEHPTLSNGNGVSLLHPLPDSQSSLTVSSSLQTCNNHSQQSPPKLPFSSSTLPIKVESLSSGSVKEEYGKAPSSCNTGREDNFSRASSPFSVESSGAPPHGGSFSSSVTYGRTYENGRRNLKDEDVTDTEARRRAKRRERNRLAAATCRQRRQDHIAALSLKVSNMKSASEAVLERLANLRTEKAILKALLAEHKCIVGSTNGKLTQLDSKTVIVVSKDLESSTDMEIFSISPTALTVTPQQLIDDGSPMRPNSLPIPSSALETILQEIEQSELITPSLDPGSGRMPCLTPLMTPGAWSTLKGSLDSKNQLSDSGLTTPMFTNPSGSISQRHSLDYSALAPEVGYLSLLSPSRVINANNKHPFSSCKPSCPLEK